MDQDRIARLVVEHGAALQNFAYQLTHDWTSAQDLVQTALLQLLRSRPKARNEVEHLGAYARQAVVNAYLSRQRLGSSSEIPVADPALPAGSNQPDLADRVVDELALWSTVGRLPPRYGAALVLRYHQGLPDRDIAAALGCTRSTVRTLVARALQVLRSDQYLRAQNNISSVPVISNGVSDDH